MIKLKNKKDFFTYKNFKIMLVDNLIKETILEDFGLGTTTKIVKTLTNKVKLKAERIIGENKNVILVEAMNLECAIRKMLDDINNFDMKHGIGFAVYDGFSFVSVKGNKSSKQVQQSLRNDSNKNINKYLSKPLNRREKKYA